jgi:IclR family KDG regulon transcriptional repressor
VEITAILGARRAPTLGQFAEKTGIARNRKPLYLTSGSEGELATKKPAKAATPKNGGGRNAPSEALGTIAKATMLLDLFSDNRTEMSLAELAGALQIPKPTVHRILAALKNRGYLRQDRAAGPYALGPRTLRLAAAYRASQPLSTIALPHMELLRKEVNQTVALYVRSGDHERTCIERLTSAHPMQVVMSIGESIPLGIGAGGRVLAEKAYSARDIAAVVTYGERVPNACGIAAPIVDDQLHVIAALDISGPLDRFPKSVISRFSKAVLRSANAISRGLGARLE